jgi:TP901 family phage tail tape measure protein
MAAFTPMGVIATVKNLGSFQRDLNKMAGSISGSGGLMNKLSKGATASMVTAFTSVAGAVASIGKAAIGAAVSVGKLAVSLGTDAVHSAIEFESAFIGVAKTTEGLVDANNELTFAGYELQQEYRRMATEIPLAVKDLLGIGEIGGQLGIAKEDLTGFTEAIAAMGVSTNLTTEAAATDLAQVANIMGTVKDEGVDAFSKMGSAIVHLGNNMATTERDIVSFATRIAGAGEIAGLTEADVFGIGAAMASVGIRAEAGGTAVQKALLAMNEAVVTGGDKLEIFAAVSDMTSSQFVDLWQRDAGDAFEEFVKGIGESGDDAVAVLDALELKDQRLMRAFLSLGNASGELTKAMDLSSTAFEENLALAREAELRYSSTESKIVMFKNSINDIKISIGDTIKAVGEGLMGMAQPFVTQVATVANSISVAFTKGFEKGGISEGVSWALRALTTHLEDGPLLSMVNFIQDKAMPAFIEFGQWLRVNIPKAIKVLSDVWKNTLSPAFKAVGEFIQNNVVPVFNLLGEWLRGVLPIYIDYLVAVWNLELLPIFRSLAEQWEKTLRPAFVVLGEWMRERLPGAIAFIRDVFDNILKPALATVGFIIAEIVIPVVAKLVAWFIRRIPPAVDATIAKWNEVVPVVMNVIKWVVGFIAAAKETYEILRGAFVDAIATVAKFFNEKLLPALEAIWGFIEKWILPVFAAIGNLIRAVVMFFLRAWVVFIQNQLIPALQIVWDVISNTLNPVLKALADVWNESIKPALLKVWEVITTQIVPAIRDIVQKGIDYLRPALEWLNEYLIGPIVEGFQKVGEWIGKAVDWINKLAEAIDNIDLANIIPFLGGSPSPLEIGLTGISRAMSELASVQLPQFNSALSAVGAPAQAAPVVSNQNVNIQVGPNTIASQMDEAIFANRVLQVVMGSIG